MAYLLKRNIYAQTANNVKIRSKPLKCTLIYLFVHVVVSHTDFGGWNFKQCQIFDRQRILTFVKYKIQYSKKRRKMNWKSLK